MSKSILDSDTSASLPNSAISALKMTKWPALPVSEKSRLASEKSGHSGICRVGRDEYDNLVAYVPP